MNIIVQLYFAYGWLMAEWEELCPHTHVHANHEPNREPHPATPRTTSRTEQARFLRTDQRLIECVLDRIPDSTNVLN